MVVDDHACSPASMRLDGADRRTIVTFSSRGSPSTTYTRPPRASTSDAQSLAGRDRPRAQPGAVEPTNACGVCTARGPSREEGLDDLLAVDALDRVGDGERRHGAVPACDERRQNALDHVLAAGAGEPRRERGRPPRSPGTSATPSRTDSARVAPPGTAGVDLAAAELLGEQDRRLLPALGRDDHDRVDPVRGLEPLEALGEQRPAAERREGFGPVHAEPLAAACCDEDRPGAHAGRRLGRCADLRPWRALLAVRAHAGQDVVEPDWASSSSICFAYMSSRRGSSSPSRTSASRRSRGPSRGHAARGS